SYRFQSHRNPLLKWPASRSLFVINKFFPSLPITLSHDYIIGAENGDGIGNHIAFGHEIECAHMNKGRGTDFQAIRPSSSRADNIKPQFPFVGFSSAIYFTGRSIESLRKKFELLNHRFQVRKYPVLGRQRHAWDFRHDWSRLHLLQALPNNLDAFTHFFDSNPVTIVRVPVFSHRYTKLTLRIGAIRFIFPQVIIDARST